MRPVGIDGREEDGAAKGPHARVERVGLHEEGKALGERRRGNPRLERLAVRRTLAAQTVRERTAIRSEPRAHGARVQLHREDPPVDAAL